MPVAHNVVADNRPAPSACQNQTRRTPQKERKQCHRPGKPVGRRYGSFRSRSSIVGPFVGTCRPGHRRKDCGEIVNDPASIMAPHVERQRHEATKLGRRNFIKAAGLGAAALAAGAAGRAESRPRQSCPASGHAPPAQAPPGQGNRRRRHPRPARLTVRSDFDPSASEPSMNFALSRTRSRSELSFA